MLLKNIGEKMTICACVMYGQFGVAGTLPSLARRLREFGSVTEHAWDDYDTVTRLISQQEGCSIVLVGYSLGANSVLNLPRLIARKVRLVIGYDPSRQSPTCSHGIMVAPDNVEEAICYYNPGTWYYGGCRYTGRQVRVRAIHMAHLLVPFSSTLHEETYQRIKSVAAESPDA